MIVFLYMLHTYCIMHCSEWEYIFQIFYEGILMLCLFAWSADCKGPKNLDLMDHA